MSKLIRDWQGNMVPAPESFPTILASSPDHYLILSVDTRNWMYRVTYGLEVNTYGQLMDALREFGYCMNHKCVVDFNDQCVPADQALEV